MPEYAIGEGHHRSRGAVLEAYCETQALEVACPACHVDAGEFCRWESGNNRRCPCPKRITAAVQVARTATNTPQEGVSDG